MSVTEEINRFIAENGGNIRDALNVALARLEDEKRKNKILQKELREAYELGYEKGANEAADEILGSV